MQLSGAVIVTAIVQFLIGASGLVGVIVAYVGPLTIAAYLCTIVAYIAAIIVDLCQPSWGVASL